MERLPDTPQQNGREASQNGALTLEDPGGLCESVAPQITGQECTRRMKFSQAGSREFQFQLFDVLDTGSLVARDRYSNLSRNSLRAVVDTFSRLAQGETGVGDDQAEALADGPVGVVPEVMLILGNGLYQADGQRAALFRTRSEDLLAAPVARVLSAWKRYRREVSHLDTAVDVDKHRRLLMRKSRSEAALALCLYGASLAEDQETHPDTARRQDAGRLLDFLEPVLAWWPEEAAMVSDLQSASAHDVAATPGDRAEQAGQLAREFLGRRVWAHQSHGLQLFLKALQHDLEAAVTSDGQQWALSLSETLQRAVRVTQTLGEGLQEGSTERVMANATRYLHLFGEITAAWMWLRQANAAARKLATAEPGDQGFYHGKLQTARYSFHWELPEVAQDLVLLQNQDSTCLDMRTDWY